MLETLQLRSGGACELCGGRVGLAGHPVGPDSDGPDRVVLVCGHCAPQLDGQVSDPSHWRCLQSSIWSEVPAVQVLSWRMLHHLPGEAWAVETLDGAYLDDEVLSWARAGLPEPEDESTVVVDCNGTRLCDGDSVTLIKDLDVKGANFTAKRGTLVKNIRLGDDPTHVEGRVQKTSIMLKTCFLKRASS